jgi:hypothetical protein
MSEHDIHAGWRVATPSGYPGSKGNPSVTTTIDPNGPKTQTTPDIRVRAFTRPRNGDAMNLPATVPGCKSDSGKSLPRCHPFGLSSSFVTK